MFLDLQVPGYIISPKQIQSNISRFNTINIILVSHLDLEKTFEILFEFFIQKTTTFTWINHTFFIPLQRVKKTFEFFALKSDTKMMLSCTISRFNTLIDSASYRHHIGMNRTVISHKIKYHFQTIKSRHHIGIISA